MLNILFQSWQSFADIAAPAAEATAQTAQVAAQQPPAWMQFVPFVIIIAVFYFFIIRPQAKRQKETQDFLSALRVGDQIVTQAGLLGRITALNDHIATLEVAHDVQVKVLRSQILMSQQALQLNTKKEGK